MTTATPEPDMPKDPTESIACDITAANFVTEVIDPSQTQLVILDFWAPWCTPCKQLGPSLEKVVKEMNGAVKLAKLDIDKNAQVAAQLQVQSVPTVFAFFNRQLIDGFMGVLPESQIREWVISLIQKTGAKAQTPEQDDLDEALAHAENCLETGDAATALELFASVLEKQPDNAQAFMGQLRSLLALGEAQKAADHLAQAPDDLAKDKRLTPIKTSIELAVQANDSQTAPVTALQEQVAANENDHQARYDLALAYYAQNDTENAIEALLEIVKRDRTWHNDAAREQLVKIFEALGHSHPQTIEARKKLSTILFS